MIGRVNSTMIAMNSIRHLQDQLAGLSQSQEQLSTNKKVNRPSDDPVGMTRVGDLTNTLRFDERFLANVQQGQSELKSLDDLISSVHDVAQRALELATQGSNLTLNATNRLTMSQEIDQLINQTVQVGNTNLAGKHILSGFRTDTIPFTRTGDAIAFAGSPSSASARVISVAENTTVQVNINGDDLIGSVTVDGAGVVNGGAGLLRTLMSLKQDLANNNVTGVQSRLDQLQSNIDTLNLQQGKAAGNLARLNQVQERIEARKDSLTEEYASIVNIDVAEVLSRMRQQESTYQASLTAVSKLNSMSLFDYLR
ncbi:MAG: flagellar hook-associated protein FlgL [Vampirovibrionales bacterium]